MRQIGLLTASSFLISIVLAVAFAVAQLRARDALVQAAGAAARTQVLVVGARDGGAVGLVGAVRAVLVPVAVVRRRDAQRVAAPELPHVTRRETCNTNESMLNYEKFINDYYVL